MIKVNQNKTKYDEFIEKISHLIPQELDLESIIIVGLDSRLVLLVESRQSVYLAISLDLTLY